MRKNIQRFIGGVIVLVIASLPFFLSSRTTQTTAQSGQRSFTDTAVTSSTANDSGSVIVSDPVIPTLSPAVRDLPPFQLEFTLDREVNPRLNLTGNTDTPQSIKGQLDPLLALQAQAPPATPDDFLTPIFNFNGQGFTGANPPDTVGDIGADHYIQMVNGSGTAVSIYDKATGILDTQFALTSLGGCATGSGDPVVLYDEQADRWLLSEFGAGSSLCVFISTSPDPTGSYFSYQFSTPGFPDYPKYGVWPDAYYVSTNESSPAAYAFDRTNMLAGNAATSQRFTAPDLSGFGFQALTPADLDGTPPPAGAPGIFMRHRDTEVHGNGNCTVAAGEDCLEIWAFDVDWVTPGNSSFTEISQINVTDFDSDLCGLFSFSAIAMPGVAKCAGNSLDPLREVVMFRLQYRNFGSHQTLVGNLVTDVTGNDDAGIRWFELRNTGSTWSLFQEGTYAPDSDSRWMAGSAMDASGNIAIGYNVSSGSTFPSLRYAGRLASDPLGTLPQSEGNMVAGTASNGSNRYGDYSAMSVDPEDGCTFWFTGQYNPASSWSTRIAAFKFDQCGGQDFTLTADPASLDICAPDDAIYDITVGSNQGYNDTVTLSTSGQPNPPNSAVFSVNSQPAPYTSTLTIGTTGAAAGSYNIQIVGMAPTSTHTTTVGLNVETAVPAAPTLVAPPNGATGVSTSPTLEWNSASGASSYLVEVATDAGFSNIVYSANVASSPHDIAGALTPLTTYYWHVRANNVCGDSAYSTAFSFTTADIPPVLLVDDDDNSPDVLSFYTTALDTLLGAGNYDIWDTGNTDNEPTAVDLAPYTTVIWFTGDEFGGFAGPGAAGETALGSWLNNGNCLFITSQDYHYDRGLTPFMTNYLGTTSVANDSGDYSSVTGQGLVFGGLGPYALNYGPVGTDYSDIIVPNGTAELSFVGNNSNGAAIDKDSGVYRTTFWAYSYEAIGGADDRLEAMQTVLNWCTPTGANIDFEKTVGTDPGACASNNVLDLPYGGGEVTYCYEVTNTGVVTLTEHDLVDSELGTLLSGFAHDLTPGSSVWITASTMITQTTVNLATWTAGDGVDTISRDSSATVNVAPPEPMIAVSPAAVTSNQAPDNQVGKTLTISNIGTGDLDWSIVELAPVVPPPTGAGPLSGSPERLGVAAPVESAIQPKAAAGGGVVADGSFEAGTPNPSWNEASTNFGTPLCTVAGCTTGTGTGPRTGSWWAWFGGIGAYEEGSVDQDVTIESGTATLSFYLEQIVCDSAADYLEVLIDGNQVFVSDGSSALCGVLGYSLQSVDISAYADGGTHNLAFHSEIFATNGGGSNFFVDDVTIDVIPGVSCSSPSDISWASVSPTSGTTTGGNASDMTVTFDSTGLVTGVYTATLCIESNDMAGNEVVSVPLTMTVETPSYGVGIDPEAALTGLAGATVTYTLYITNTGNTADTFDLAATGNSWTTTLSDSSVSLNVGESTMVWVTVDIPTGVADGDMDVATVTATSAGDSGVSASATLTTTAEVEGYFIYLPFVAKDA